MRLNETYAPINSLVIPALAVIGILGNLFLLLVLYRDKE